MCRRFFTRNHLQTSSSESRDASIHPLARSFDLIVGSLSRASRVYPPVAANASRTPLARASAALFANDRSTCTTAVGTTRARHSSNTASCTSRRTSIPTDRVSSYSASDAATSIDQIRSRQSERPPDVSIDARDRCILPRSARARTTRRATTARVVHASRGDDRRRRSRRFARARTSTVASRIHRRRRSSRSITTTTASHRVASRRTFLIRQRARLVRVRVRRHRSFERVVVCARARAQRRRAPARRLNPKP